MTKKHKISDFLIRIKNQILIDDGTFYKRVTVSGNHNGVKQRDEIIGATIGTKKQFTIRGGDFILSKIDARNGAFGIIPLELDNAIITGNFWTYSVDANIVDTEWFFYFTHSYNFIQICIESSAGSTHRKYLDEKVFLNHKIILPKIDQQKEMVKRYKRSSKISKKLSTEIQSQKQLLKKLKQSILQEAIQGKLTENWRKQNIKKESASELLKRIKTEKTQLIKDKKIKKEKPLPKITKEDIPYELPEGWVWSRLGDVNNTFLGGAAFSSSRFIKESNIQVLRISNIKNDLLNVFKNPVFIDKTNADENLRNELFPRDILVTMTGTREKRDYCFTVELTESNFDNKRLFLNQRVGCFRLNENIDSTYTTLALKSQSLLEPVFESSTGSANQANISKTALLDIVFPLPPLEEQKEIVKKVEALMQQCQELEQEIQISEANAQMLMQAVLKEAFEGEKKLLYDK